MGDILLVGVNQSEPFLPNPTALLAYDISDPSNPVRLENRVDLDDAVREITIRGDYAYLADDRAGLQIVDVGDVRDPSRFRVVGSHGDWTGTKSSAYVGLKA